MSVSWNLKELNNLLPGLRRNDNALWGLHWLCKAWKVQFQIPKLKSTSFEKGYWTAHFLIKVSFMLNYDNKANPPQLFFFSFFNFESLKSLTSDHCSIASSSLYDIYWTFSHAILHYPCWPSSISLSLLHLRLSLSVSQWLNINVNCGAWLQSCVLICHPFWCFLAVHSIYQRMPCHALINLLCLEIHTSR